MNNTSDKAVADYLSNMFMDLTLSDPSIDLAPTPYYTPLDSIGAGCRLVPCLDPFKLMDIDNETSIKKIWLAYISIINLSVSLPNGYLKQYCLRQCLTLKNQLDNIGVH